RQHHHRQQRMAPSGDELPDAGNGQQAEHARDRSKPATDRTDPCKPHAGPRPERIALDQERGIHQHDAEQGRNRKVDQHGVHRMPEDCGTAMDRGPLGTVLSPHGFHRHGGSTSTGKPTNKVATAATKYRQLDTRPRKRSGGGESTGSSRSARRSECPVIASHAAVSNVSAAMPRLISDGAPASRGDADDMPASENPPKAATNQPAQTAMPRYRWTGLDIRIIASPRLRSEPG